MAYERDQEKHRAYLERTKEHRRKWQKAYDERNREKKRKRMKAYKDANRAKLRAEGRAYYANNKEKFQAYRERNREQILAYFKAYGPAYRERTREKKRERSKAYRPVYFENNREKVLEGSRRRRARLRGSGGTILARDWERLINRHDGLCAYCGDPATEQDHVIPIARGGRHTIGNVLPVCGPCNRQKYARLLIEWQGRPR